MSSHRRLIQHIRKFNIRAKRLIPIQNRVYRIIDTNGKHYALKQTSETINRLRWMDHALLAVRKNGFARIGWRNPTSRTGRNLFVRTGSGNYIITPWIHGRWPSVNSKQDMRVCGVALAQFHKAYKTSGLPTSGTGSKVGAWFAELLMNQRLMKQWIKRAILTGEIDSFLRKNKKEILQYANESRGMLTSARYRALCRTHKHLITLCHGDGGPTNIILNTKGTHFIDFETLRIDFRIYDLYKFIYNSCKEASWNFSLAQAFLNGYHSVMPLVHADYMFLRALLRFPRTTYLLLRELRHTGFKNSKRTKALLQQALHSERKLTAFIKKLS
jgi:CotS family spore coat protein